MLTLSDEVSGSHASDFQLIEPVLEHVDLCVELFRQVPEYFFLSECVTVEEKLYTGVVPSIPANESANLLEGFLLRGKVLCISAKGVIHVHSIDHAPSQELHLSLYLTEHDLSEPEVASVEDDASLALNEEHYRAWAVICWDQSYSSLSNVVLGVYFQRNYVLA